MRKLINRYRKTIQSNCLGTDETSTNTVIYWQNKLFSSTMELVIPLSLITLVPGVTYSLMVDLPLLAFFDVLSFFIMLYVAFGKGMPVEARKLFFILSIYFIAVYLLVFIGFRGPGFLFLYTACVFAILILPTRYAYWWSWINVAICALFTLVLHYDLSPTDEVNALEVGEWIAISVNVIFLSFVTSGLLPVLISGLSQSFGRQNQLQQKLHRQKRSLEVALQDLERKNTDLEQFGHVASHDLQEPLRTITSFLHLLEKKYQPVLDEKARQYIHFAVDGANRMKKIITDLLEFSRVGSHAGQKEAVDIREIVEEVGQLQGKLIEEKGAKIECQNIPPVISYRSPLAQIFQNLIGNALKYSREEARPMVRVSSEPHDGHWRFSVEDNGIGIQEENFERVFDLFYRVHGKEAYGGGTGMGLATVKKLVEGLGGRIWLTSEAGKGSTFYFTIPKQN